MCDLKSYSNTIYRVFSACAHFVRCILPDSCSSPYVLYCEVDNCLHKFHLLHTSLVLFHQNDWHLFISFIPSLFSPYLGFDRLHCHFVSWETEGRYCNSKMFRWEPEGRYCCTKSIAIAPFWFSTEHLWSAIAPFWLSADDLLIPTINISYMHLLLYVVSPI